MQGQERLGAAASHVWKGGTSHHRKKMSFLQGLGDALCVEFREERGNWGEGYDLSCRNSFISDICLLSCGNKAICVDSTHHLPFRSSLVTEVFLNCFQSHVCQSVSKSSRIHNECIKLPSYRAGTFFFFASSEKRDYRMCDFFPDELLYDFFTVLWGFFSYSHHKLGI